METISVMDNPQGNTVSEVRASTALDLIRSFCGSSDLRAYLKTPFSVGEWTYATDGRIAVRVPRLQDVGGPEPDEPKIKTSVESLFADIPADGYEPLPSVEVPKNEELECEECDGRGSEHDCPNCNCLCDNCRGSGQEPPYRDVSVAVGDAIIAGRYFVQLQTLPEIALTKPLKEIKNAKAKACFFRFDGGEGALMPMHREAGTHIVAPTAIAKATGTTDTQRDSVNERGA